MPEILAAVPPKTFTTGQRRSRACMEEAVSGLPPDNYELLLGAATAKRRRLQCTPSTPLAHPLERDLSDRIQTVAVLTMREILDALPRKTFSSAQTRSRASLDGAVASLLQE
ncbi:hypothetical protein V8E53_006358, partial [Lactarius tabidus]